MGASLSNFDINFLGDNSENKNIKTNEIEHIQIYVNKIISSTTKEAIQDLNLNNNSSTLDYKNLYEELLQKYQLLNEKYHNLEFQHNILNDTCNKLIIKEKTD